MGSSSRLVRRLALAVSVAALALAVAAPTSSAGTDTQSVIDATNALKERILTTAKHLHGHHKLAERHISVSRQVARLLKSVPDVDALFTETAYGIPAGDALDAFLFADYAFVEAARTVHDGGRRRLTDEILRNAAHGALSGLGRELHTAAQGGTQEPAPQALFDALLAAEDSIDSLRSKLKDLRDKAIEKRIEELSRAKSLLRQQYFQQDLGGVPLAAVSTKVDAIGGPLVEAATDTDAGEFERARGDLKDAARACGKFVKVLQGALTGF
ncbi:MAG: hypothetical protein QOI10_1920 [Solirubrobacterales bacterium]|jgi:hypothetical protein|nr:hypothetical protein [Solirubrobacterales bacterium]